MSAHIFRSTLVPGALAALALALGAGAADASAASLTVTSVSPATQDLSAEGKPNPVGVSVQYTSDVDGELSLSLDSAGACDPVADAQAAKPSNVATTARGFAPAGADMFGGLDSFTPPNQATSGSWLVCVYMRHATEATQLASATGGPITVNRPPASQNWSATLSLTPPSPGSQTWVDTPSTPSARFTTTASGTTSHPVKLELYWTADAACAPRPVVPSQFERPSYFPAGEASIPAGSFSMPVDIGAWQYGTTLVCGYLKGPSFGSQTAPDPVAATAGPIRLLPPACPTGELVAGVQPPKPAEKQAWLLPVVAPAAGRLEVETTAETWRFLGGYPQQAGPTEIQLPLSNALRYDLYLAGKSVSTTVTVLFTFDVPVIGCALPDGSIVHSLPVLRRTFPVTLHPNGRSSLQPSKLTAAGPTLASVVESGVLPLGTVKFPKAGTATVELFLAPKRTTARAAALVRLGKLVKKVKKGKPVSLKVKLTAKGKTALKIARKDAVVRVRTTFKPKGGGKKKVTTRTVTLK